MPKAYFEPESLNALAEVFCEARRRLSVHDINDPTKLDLIAGRILRLAADGVPPWTILREIGGQIDQPYSGPEDDDDQPGKAARQSTQPSRTP